MGLEALQKIDNETSAPNPHRLSLSLSTISIEDNTRLAYHCLKLIMSNTSNTSNLRYSFKPTFTFMKDNNIWWPSSFGVSLILVILSSIQRQYRHILVSEIIRRLDSLSEGSSLSEKVTFIEMLTSILTSDLTVVGLSILEVLDCLLSHLLNSLKNGNDKFEQMNINFNFKVSSSMMTEKSQDLETIIVQKLIICIGGLATHIYYANQISDIVEHIIQHLNLQTDRESKQGSNSDSITEEIPLDILRKTLLKCLDVVIQTYKESEKRLSEMSRSEVPVEIFHNTIGLCMDEDPGEKIIFQNMINYCYFNTNFLFDRCKNRVCSNPFHIFG